MEGLGITDVGRPGALEAFARALSEEDAGESALFAVNQTLAPTSKGPCALPIFYRRGEQFGVFFRADLDKARALLTGTTFEPWPILGAAIVAIYAWDYQDSSVGSYGELGLGTLPVTTEVAHAAGVEIWGYPKYVTEIETRFDADGASVRLGQELEVSIGRLGGPKLKAQPITTYTERDGRLLRTVISVNHRVRWGRGGASVKILGDGPTTQKMRVLGIETRQPLIAFRAEGFRATLPAGQDIGAARATD